MRGKVCGVRQRGKEMKNLLCIMLLRKSYLISNALLPYFDTPENLATSQKGRERTRNRLKFYLLTPFATLSNFQGYENKENLFL
jgi:hypothetical protein